MQIAESAGYISPIGFIQKKNCQLNLNCIYRFNKNKHNNMRACLYHNIINNNKLNQKSLKMLLSLPQERVKFKPNIPFLLNGNLFPTLFRIFILYLSCSWISKKHWIYYCTCFIKNYNHRNIFIIGDRIQISLKSLKNYNLLSISVWKTYDDLYFLSSWTRKSIFLI